MVLVGALAASLAVGLARGGRLGNLARMHVRYLWLPLALFAAQSVVVIFPVAEWDELGRLGPVVVLGSYGGLIAFVLLNRHLPGARLVLLGASLNLAVIAANGGYMPVSPDSLERAGHSELIVARGDTQYVQGSKDVVLDRGDTRLWPLSDIFVIPQSLPLSGSFSIGDVAIALGAFVLINRGMLGSATQESRPLLAGWVPRPGRTRPDEGGAS